MVGKPNSSATGKFRVLTVDFGTTRCKAAVVGARGEILAISAVENSLHKRGEGVYEQDALEFEESMARCVRRALFAAKGKVDIAVVTGQGSAPVCLDQAGKPVGPVFSHLDTRADEQRMTMREAFGELGYVPAKIFPNLLWMKQNDPKRFARIRHVLDVREYVGYLLTGQYTFDTRGMTMEQVEKLSALAGLDAAVMGRIHDSAHPIGTSSEKAKNRFGLTKGVPVLQAPGDTVCAAVGSGLGEDGVVCDVTGSTEVVAAAARSGTQSGGSRLYLIPHLEEGRAFLFTSPPHGFVFKWFVDTFYGDVSAGRRYAQVDEDVSGIAPSEDNPLFVPLIQTAGYSYRIETNFFGVGVSHTRAHLARSVMEGLVMRVRTAMDGIREGGTEVKRVRLSGGGANSAVWNKIRANVFGVEAELIQTRETSCLGAAMVACVAAGVCRDFDEAEKEMVHVTRSFKPESSATKIYDARYAEFVGKMKMLEEQAV